MRLILGLALIVAASLGGIEYATKLVPTTAATGAPQVQATLLAPALAPATETFGGIVQTVAATEPAPLPPVTVSPQAPHAEPITPIVEPIKVPKGTHLKVTAHFDNSVNNKFNPDPNQTVYYGDMTWEEMMFPFFSVTVEKGREAQKVIRVLKGKKGDGA